MANLLQDVFEHAGSRRSEPGISDVLDGGYCAGCGACAAVSGKSMQLNEFGEYLPDTVPDGDQTRAVCPFLRPDLNEDALAERLLPECANYSRELGRFDRIFAAHVLEGTFRSEGSSGGVGSWIGVELLRRGEIDGVIHVLPVSRKNAEDPFFRYGISVTEDELRRGAHSHYHVVEISEVMQQARTAGKRFLFIGVPCMVKAVRRLQLADEVLRANIPYVVSLICGHLKSVNWSLSLGWAAGLTPEEMAEISFRVKSEKIPAKAYYYRVRAHGEREGRVLNSAEVTGGKFNMGAMMLNACDYCDDVVGETADLSIGDAWLPRYAFDWRGKNMLIVRNPHLSSLLVKAADESRLHLELMTPSEAAKAQSGGFRHRREGLRYRLALAGSKGKWAPVKRIFSDRKPLPHRRLIYGLRQHCAAESRRAFRKALTHRDFSLYTRHMEWRFKLLRLLEIMIATPRILSVRLQRVKLRLQK